MKVIRGGGGLVVAAVALVDLGLEFRLRTSSATRSAAPGAASRWAPRSGWGGAAFGVHVDSDVLVKHPLTGRRTSRACGRRSPRRGVHRATPFHQLSGRSAMPSYSPVTTVMSASATASTRELHPRLGPAHGARACGASYYEIVRKLGRSQEHQPTRWASRVATECSGNAGRDRGAPRDNPAMSLTLRWNNSEPSPPSTTVCFCCNSR